MLRYKTSLDRETLDSLNKHNTIIGNTTNINNRHENRKEFNKHSGELDSNINNTDEFFNSTVYNGLDFEDIPDNNPVVTLESGDDIVLVDALKSKYNYKGGPEYSDAQDRDNKRLGIGSIPLKILYGGLLPKVHFNHQKLYENQLNNYMSSVCV